MANPALNQAILQSLFRMNPNLRDATGLNQAIAPSVADYGMRLDNTRKQNGYFGPLMGPSGIPSTELSIGVNFDGKEQLIPSLVPTLNGEEVKYLLSGADPTKEIVDKAVSFARQRMAYGLSPFATNEEIPYGIKQ